MSAEQPSVEALVERVREAFPYSRELAEEFQMPKTLAGYAALDSLTAALERETQEHRACGESLIEATEKWERAGRERDEWQFANPTANWKARCELAEARAQKAEARNERQAASVVALQEKLEKAEAVVEAARRFDQAYRSDREWDQEADELGAALTAYDEPAP